MRLILCAFSVYAADENEGMVGNAKQLEGINAKKFT
jgi:hypothetical protein